MHEKTVKETIDNTKYTFNEDGTFKVSTWMLGRTVEYEGTYTVDGKTMTQKESESNQEVKFDTTVSATELVLVQSDGDNSITLTFERE